MSTSKMPVPYGLHHCHELKCWPEFFRPIALGEKRFEIRVNDRDFAVGDYLWLREWCPDTQKHLDGHVVMSVSYLLSATEFLGLTIGYVALSIAPVSESVAAGVISAFAKSPSPEESA